MQSRYLLGRALLSALIFTATPAWAVYTGVVLPADEAQDFQSGRITLPGGDAVPIVSYEECEQSRTEDEECDRSTGWFVRTAGGLADGIRVRVDLRRSDGSTGSFEGTMKDGRIQVSTTGSERASRPPPVQPDGGRWMLAAGYADFTLPERNGALGITLSPDIGDEIVTSYAPRSINGKSLEIRGIPKMLVGALRRDFRPYLSFGWAQGDGTATAQTPAGPEGNGFTYPVDVSGSPGLNFGTSPADVHIEAELDQFRLGLGGLTYPYPDSDYFCGLGVRAERRTLDLVGRLQVPAFTGSSEVSVVNSQEVRTDAIAFPWTTGIRHSLSERVAIVPQLTIAPGYQRTKLSGHWTSVCLPCGPDSPERDVRIDYDDSDSGFFYSAGVAVTLDFQATERLNMGLIASYEHVSDIGRAANRETPEHEFTHADTGSGSRRDFRFAVGFRF